MDDGDVVLVVLLELGYMQLTYTQDIEIPPENLITWPNSHIALYWMFESTASCCDSNYQPVLADWHLPLCFQRGYCNLSFVSNITEKIVLSQLSVEFTSNNLFSPSQSAYRPGHRTEATLLKVMNDILRALDDGDVALFCSFPWFVSRIRYHRSYILLHRLEHLYGFSGTPLNWFKSYLSNRTQTVKINNELSRPTKLSFGVPQGSVLGPILFILYTKPLTTLIRQHSISDQSFADDTHLYDSYRPEQVDITVQGTHDCILEVRSCQPLSAPLSCPSLITATLCYQVHQNSFLTNFKRSKTLQPDLFSKLASKNMSNPSFKNFTGYQSAQESSTKFKLCGLTPSLKLVLSISLNSWLLTTLPDNSALRQIQEPFESLWRKEKLSENDLFLSQVGPRQWNSLSHDVRHLPSSSSFKKALKTNVFISA